MDRQRAASIRLTGNPDPHVFDGIDPARGALVSHELAARFREMTVGGHVQWAIVAAPNEGWATQVFGEPDLERLWEAVSVAMRLDAGSPEDVVEEWRRHRDRLGARAQSLTDLRLDAVRYHGQGTDLTVGLIAGCVWTGGGLSTARGCPTCPTCRPRRSSPAPTGSAPTASSA